MKRFLLFILCSCVLVFPVQADMLVPLSVFAEKKQNQVQKNVFVWNGQEYSCDAPNGLYFKTEKEAKESCGLCPNRVIKRINGGKNIKVNGKDYHTCRDEIGSGECLGKERIKDIYMCIPKSIKVCPADKPQLDTFGFCHSCDEEKGIDVSWCDVSERSDGWGHKILESKKGSVCDNRKLIALGWSQPDFYSVLDTCPLDRPLQDYLGGCHACDEPEAVVTEKKRTFYEDKIWDFIDSPIVQGRRNAFCPNREDIISSNDHPYYTIRTRLKNCPLNRPLRDEDGGCHACDEQGVIILNDGKTFWGNISYGKVYDANANVIGKIVEATPFEKKHKVEYIYRDSRSIQEEKLRDEKRKTGKFVPEWDTDYLWNMYNLNDQQIGTVKMEFNGRCEGDKSCGSFLAIIYDMQGNVIARGGGEHNGTNPKNNTSTYYWEKVPENTVCPNRKMYRTDINAKWGGRSNVLVSGLKK